MASSIVLSLECIGCFSHLVAYSTGVKEIPEQVSSSFCSFVRQKLIDNEYYLF